MGIGLYVLQHRDVRTKRCQNIGLVTVFYKLVSLCRIYHDGAFCSGCMPSSYLFDKGYNVYTQTH